MVRTPEVDDLVSALVFLGIAAVISVIGFGVLWLFNRPPRSIEAHMKEFSRQIQALAPETELPSAGRGRRGGRPSRGGSSESGRRSG